jgi:hypothetical protein
VKVAWSIALFVWVGAEGDFAVLIMERLGFDVEKLVRFAA